jgi:TPR repeat protein
MIGCRFLASEIRDGRVGAPDPRRSTACETLACEQDDWQACNDLAGSYESGRGVGVDQVKARQLYKDSCDHGVLVGCSNLGINLLGPPSDTSDPARPSGLRATPEDAKAAVALFERACDGGYPAGCTNLAAMYGEGVGVAKDEAKAVSLYQHACDADEALSCVNLAMMYESGREGLAKDEPRARTLYERGCAGGNVPGCTNLAVMYGQGRGGARDESRAVELYRKACAGGDALGCQNLDRRGVKH